MRGGEKELIEKLGRNDPCLCGSGHSFQEMLPHLRPVSTIASGRIIGGNMVGRFGVPPDQSVRSHRNLCHRNLLVGGCFEPAIDVIVYHAQKVGFITPSGPFDEPVSHFRVALLTVATALSVVVLILLLTVSPTTHAIKIDVWDARDWPDPAVRRPVHVLAIRADGSMTFSGAPVANLRTLRQLVDLDQMALSVPMLRVEPDPNLRYADFLEVLAVIKHANVYDFCIDFDVGRRRGEFKCAPLPVLE